MDAKNTDIFISYRRIDGLDIARQIEQALRLNGFENVFFDFHSMREGLLNPQIKTAIRNCKDFILLLTPQSMMRCGNEGDWVATEIQAAMDSGCNIIPVEINEPFTAWPNDFPKQFDIIRQKRIKFLSFRKDDFFDASIDMLICWLKSKPNKTPTHSNSTNIATQRLHRIEKNGKFGFVNGLGEIVIPCEWYKADKYSSDGAARVQDDTGRYGFIDTSGNTIIRCEWMYASERFSEGLLCVKDNNKWGFINKEGEIVHPIIWDAVQPFSNGIALVKGKSKKKLGFLDGTSLWGCIDKYGHTILPYMWKDCGYAFREGLLNIQDKTNKWGFVNINGKITIPCQWENASAFSEGLANVTQSPGLYGKWGYINNSGKAIIPTRYFYAFPFNNGVACCQNKKDDWEVINKRGQVLFHFKSFSPLHFSENLALIWEGFRSPVRFVNLDGLEVIPPVWKNAHSFSSGLAAVENDEGKWGFIDKDGNIAIPCQWDYAESFKEDYAWVKDKETWRLIDKNGNYL